VSWSVGPYLRYAPGRGALPVEKEVRRLRAAIKDVKRHLAELGERAVDRAGVDEARIFDAQI